MNFEGKYYGNEFWTQQKCLIQSTKIGTHENKAIHSI